MKERETINLALSLAWTMLFSLLIPLLVGIWLDRKLDTTPLFILIGTLLGVLAATVGVARMTIRTFHSMGGDDKKEGQTNGEEEPE